MFPLCPIEVHRLRQGLLLAGMLLVAATAPAQSERSGDGKTPLRPGAYTEVNTQAPPTEEPSTAMKVLQAVCWYLPNRAMDILDVPRFNLALGEGMGFTARATKWLFWASWWDSDAWAFGINKRTPPFYYQRIDEHYFRFLAASSAPEGYNLDRDPTEVGLSIHLIFIGLNFALSAGEALDFFTGIVGIDLANDDKGPFFESRTPQKEYLSPMREPANDPAARGEGGPMTSPTGTGAAEELPMDEPLVYEPAPPAEAGESVEAIEPGAYTEENFAPDGAPH